MTDNARCNLVSVFEREAGASERTANALAAVAAVGVGAAAGGVAGAATAWNADANNRQLHPTERARIAQLAEIKARELCAGIGQSDCVQSVTLYWSDMLQRAAEGRIDDVKAAQNDAYYQQVINAAGIPGSEAAVTGLSRDFFVNLQTAQEILNRDAGQVILNTRGVPQTGRDGQPQTMFAATAQQRADEYLNLFPGSQPRDVADVIPGREQRDQDLLARLTAPNGGLERNYTLDELLLGGALANRLTGTAVRTLDGVVARSERSILELGGGPTGSKIPDARNIDPRDVNAFGRDMRNLSQVPSGSQQSVVVNNPYLDGVKGADRNVMSYLPEAARVTQPGGEIAVSGTANNPFFNRIPSQAELDALGLEIKYRGPVPNYLQQPGFSQTSGQPIKSESMDTIVFIKKKR